MPTDEKSVKEYNQNFKKWMDGKGMGHSHLEKPAMYAQVGDLNGKTILCLGCGAGEEAEYLRSLGSEKVVGIDISDSLINEAKKNFPNIEFKIMDMEKLDFSDESFDLVYSSLVLHYVSDWKNVLGEVRRVLKKKGLFLFSTHNPSHWSAYKKEDDSEKLHILGYRKDKKNNKLEFYGDYCNVRKINDIWFGNFKVTYYHKPFSSIIQDIIKSGLKIVDCVEPRPLESSKEIDVEFWEKNNKLSLFIIFKLQK